MKKAPDQSPLLAWYRVPEMWLILILLGATVLGSFALLFTAIRTSDTHIRVPEDVPRPSTLPPIQSSPAATSPATRDDTSVP